VATSVAAVVAVFLATGLATAAGKSEKRAVVGHAQKCPHKNGKKCKHTNSAKHGKKKPSSTAPTYSAAPAGALGLPGLPADVSLASAVAPASAPAAEGGSTSGPPTSSEGPPSPTPGSPGGGVRTSPITLPVASPSTSEVPNIEEISATAGSHGYPYGAVPETPIVAGAPFIKLSNFGYVEREFKMSGGDTIYRQNGPWSSNGEWNVSVSQSNVPYTTRIVTRYPEASKFNGTVVFEWLNDTTGGDQDPVWSEMYGTLIKHGFAYVGVTAQKPGMQDLAAWDAQRYGSLGDTNDGQSYEIFTQAANAIRADSGTLLGGLTPKTLIGTGDSQSAFRVDTYVNAIEPLTHAFNGFLAVGRAVSAAPIGEGLLSLFNPFVADIRTNNSAPFIQLNTQGDIEELDAGVSRQPDNSTLRTWEVAGASHIDAHEGNYEIETLAREKPEQPIPSCVFGTPVSGTGTPLDGHNQPDNMELYQVEDAAIMAENNWLVNGVAPPHALKISTTPILFGLYDLVRKNQYGVGYGGIHLPDAEVPTENYSAINFSNILTANTFNVLKLRELLESAFSSFMTGGIGNEELREAGLCLLSGYFTDLSKSTLASMYPTHASYASKIKAAANADVAAGFMTPEGAESEIARAEAGVGPIQDPPLSWPMTE
jgi:hypothetical protein